MRELFTLFEEHGSIRATLAAVRQNGWTLKSWTCRDGSLHLGGSFNGNALRRLIGNVLYTGDVRHKGTIYAGEHAPIVDRETWDRVQLRIERYAPETTPRNKHDALLKGLLHCDACGTPIIPVQWGRKGCSYRYYVCRNAREKGVTVCPARSLPAREIEAAVLQRLVSSGAMNGTTMPDDDLGAQISFVQRHIERVGYDWKSGSVNIRFREA